MTQQQHLRLQAMMHIQHDDAYYMKGLASRGVDPTKLTHEQISAWKATIKAIEADILIEAAEKMPVSRSIEDIDLTFLK